MPLTLGELIEDADHIVTGTVSEVVPGNASGSQLATVDVEQELKGVLLPAPPDPSPRVTLLGSTREAFRPSFTVGDRVLVFLAAIAAVDDAASVAGPDSRELAMVGGEQGAVVLAPESLDVARSVVEKAIDLGPALGLADVRDELGRTPPLPDGLDGALLEELSLRASGADGPLLAEIACNAATFFSEAAQTWAITRVGILAVAEARTCLEEIVASGADLGESLAAAGALGGIGDPRSVKVLERVIAEKGDGNLRRADGGLRMAAGLALGSIGDPKSIKTLRRLAREGNDLALHSTAIHALASIGGRKVLKALDELSEAHADVRIRRLAAAAARHVRERLSTGRAS